MTGTSEVIFPPCKANRITTVNSSPYRDLLPGQRHTGRRRLRPQRREPRAVQPVVHPAAPPGRGHQARLAQHPQVVGQQVRRHRHLLLQVTHAPATAGQHTDQAKPNRVSQRRKACRQFNRGRINSR